MLPHSPVASWHKYHDLLWFFKGLDQSLGLAACTAAAAAAATAAAATAAAVAAAAAAAIDFLIIMDDYIMVDYNG